MLPNTRFVFLGTPQFSAVILERLIQSGFVPSLVVTNPDRPVGRKGAITPPPVKTCVKKQVESIKQDIKIIQPENVAEILNTLYSLPNTARPDFAVLAAYGKIIPKNIIEAFPQGIIVVHPSLLPQYRGATPIQSAILSGEDKTGTTLILMDEKVDHGSVLAQRELELRISNFKFQNLHDKLAELSADLLIETLPRYLNGEIKPAVQDEALATYTKKFSSDDAFVPETDLERAQKEGGEIAASIDRKVRALNPEPGVWTLQGGKRVKLLEAELADGKLKLKKIQTEGGKPMVIGNL
jgi:methionyl-tRNA formyltransferase